MDINDNKLKRFYTVSAAIGYILCSLYAFIYCASYGLVHLHLPISSESVLSGVFDDFFYNFFAVTKFILEDKPQLCDKFLLSLHVKSDFK